MKLKYKEKRFTRKNLKLLERAEEILKSFEMGRNTATTASSSTPCAPTSYSSASRTSSWGTSTSTPSRRSGTKRTGRGMQWLSSTEL